MCASLAFGTEKGKVQFGCFGLNPLDLQKGGETHNERAALTLIPASESWEMHPEAWANGPMGIHLLWACLFSQGHQIFAVVTRTSFTWAICSSAPRTPVSLLPGAQLQTQCLRLAGLFSGSCGMLPLGFILEFA